MTLPDNALQIIGLFLSAGGIALIMAYSRKKDREYQTSVKKRVDEVFERAETKAASRRKQDDRKKRDGISTILGNPADPLNPANPAYYSLDDGQPAPKYGADYSSALSGSDSSSSDTSSSHSSSGDASPSFDGGGGDF